MGNPDLLRCPWADATKLDYLVYHDQEWGVPVREDRKLFEFLLLEAAQAGLSWYTILRKREAYREAFAGFDPQTVALYTEADIASLLANPGIVRNRLKVRSAICNARHFLAIQAHYGSFATYLWQFVDGKPQVNAWRTQEECPTTSPQANALARDLKQRGFTFMGPTVCYAYMQAVGLVNDHLLDCFRRQEIIDSCVTG